MRKYLAAAALASLPLVGLAWGQGFGPGPLPVILGLIAGTPNLVVTSTTISTTNPQHSPADGGSHSYTVISADLTKQVILAGTFTALAVPQATGSFGAGACFYVTNKGALTATPTTSTVNGASSLPLAANQTSEWCSDGTNWLAAIGAALDPSNATNLASGTVPAARLPLATTGAFGAVKPDGSTITVSAGVISSVSGGAGTVTNPANLTTHAPLIGGANGTTDAKATAPLTNGQLICGVTGADPVPCTITQGSNVTVTNGAGSITIAASGGGSSVAAFPQGRLTLVTATPVMVSDQTAKTTIFYDTYQGNLYPNWSGSAMANVTITADEISMGLDSVTPHIASGSLYDVFGTAAAAICAGPAWSSTSTRGTGAGTTELQLKSGVWTNKNSLTNCWGGASGTTNLGAIAANQGTYLGTFYATANGQTGMAFKPAAASGGANAFLGLYNAYNRVAATSRSLDSTASWTYGTTTWRNADNSASNRISFVDGLAQSSSNATYSNITLNSATIQLCGMGVGFNTSGSTAPDASVDSAGSPSSGNFQAITAPGNFPPNLGLNFLQAQEIDLTGGGDSCTFFGSIAGPPIDHRMHLLATIAGM